jgi:hypothetical protein
MNQRSLGMDDPICSAPCHETGTVLRNVSRHEITLTYWTPFRIFSPRKCKFLSVQFNHACSPGQALSGQHEIPGRKHELRNGFEWRKKGPVLLNISQEGEQQ